MFGFLKQLGWAGTLIAGGLAAGWAITTYVHENRLAFQKQWVSKHIELCVSASETVGALSSRDTEAEWNKDIAKFWQLYWGPLALIEPQPVAQKMVDFGKALKTTEFANRFQLGPKAIAVSKACRDHIDQIMQNDWRFDPSDFLLGLKR